MIASRLLERMLPAPVAPHDASVLEATATLTSRETELLGLLARGYKYAEVSQLMDISLATVQTHVRRIYNKLAVNSRAEAVFEAKALGILPS